MIYRFHELTDDDRRQLHAFLKTHRPDDDQSYEDNMAYLGGELFENGANVLIEIEEERIAGCIGVITREIPVKGEAYLVRFHVESESRPVAARLLKLAAEVCEAHQAARILAGIAPTDAFVGRFVREHGFDERHRALVLSMDLAASKAPPFRREGELTYRRVDENSRGEYQTLHNDVFRFVPNGGAVTDVEMEELIAKHAASPDLLGVVYRGDRLIGFHELELIGDEGWIHAVGIDPACQGRGYGRELLDDLIARLGRMGARCVKLVVMSNNVAAIGLYRAIGFREERVLSIWYGREIGDEESSA
ncbi:GNAT family N-acetyltransferase [Paenibacillus xanthanilyticus]|uniref:GNAT family N-acetyltransferase n=1 Tax=Paenibacillus xanthanilyticus TaxID=1783531 RepID=A0ABV8JXH5_9BACL